MTRPNPAIANDPYARRLGLLYAALFFAAGWQLPFLPLWLSARGLDPAAIGTVLAAYQFVRVPATPAGTRLADRHAPLKAAINAAALAMVLALTLVAVSHGFAAILIAIALLGMVAAPIHPLTDAYALKGLALRKRGYGPVRLWGSVAFIVANLTGGLALGLIAPANLIWLMLAANCAIALAAALLVPLPRDAARPPSGAMSGHGHLRQPAFLLIAAASSLIQASHAVYYGFSTLDWTAKGLDGTTIGVLWALGVVAEIALFALVGRFSRIGPLLLIGIGAGGAVLRWGATALDPPLAILASLQFLHALSFGATHLGTMMFLGTNAPEGSRAAAQGDISAANSIVMAAASAASGLLYAAGGSGLAYLAMAILAAAGGIFAAMAARVMATAPSTPQR